MSVEYTQGMRNNMYEHHIKYLNIVIHTVSQTYIKKGVERFRWIRPSSSDLWLQYALVDRTVQLSYRVAALLNTCILSLILLILLCYCKSIYCEKIQIFYVYGLFQFVSNFIWQALSAVLTGIQILFILIHLISSF